VAGDASVKQARVVGWADVGDREAALVGRCVAGDDEAYAELVSEHQRMVMQLLLNLTSDREEALDLSQDVFLRVFRTLYQFRGQSSMRTWIYRIAVNLARNHHRWWRRRHRADQVSLDAHVEKYGDLPSRKLDDLPDRVLAQKEAALRLWAALDRLPFDQRTTIVLREIDGLSYDEIAFSLGVAVGTVKSRLTRARQALRIELGEVGS
jgi:RNA polymerase sigma-70 factor (ECF subfamily)